MSRFYDSLCSTKMNCHAKYVGQRSFGLFAHTYRHTDTRIESIVLQAHSKEPEVTKNT